MEDWLKENWFKLGIVVALIIAAFAFYQATVILPRERAERDAAEQAQKNEAAEAAKVQLRIPLNSASRSGAFRPPIPLIAAGGDRSEATLEFFS